MISTIGLNKTAGSILGLLDHARCILDGENQDIPIYDTKVEGNVVSVFVLFDNQYTGQITRVELIDTDGDVYASQPENVEKVDSKLFLATFKFTITEVIQ